MMMKLILTPHQFQRYAAEAVAEVEDEVKAKYEAEANVKAEVEVSQGDEGKPEVAKRQLVESKIEEVVR